MREELDRLTDASDKSRVTLQVVPFAVGAHLALAGSFTILKLEELEEQASSTT